jgi:hypothetical protein
MKPEIQTAHVSMLTILIFVFYSTNKIILTQKLMDIQKSNGAESCSAAVLVSNYLKCFDRYDYCNL